jgi:hypothetical protein
MHDPTLLLEYMPLTPHNCAVLSCTSALFPAAAVAMYACYALLLLLAVSMQRSF